MLKIRVSNNTYFYFDPVLTNVSLSSQRSCQWIDQVLSVAHFVVVASKFRVLFGCMSPLAIFASHFVC